MGPWKSNIHVIRLPGGEKRREPKKVLQQIMVENFPRACKRHKHKFSRSWITIRITQRNLHSYENWKSLKTARENDTLLLRGNNLKDSRFIIKNHGCQKEVANRFQVLKEKNYQSRILYPVKIMFQGQMGNKDVLQWEKMKRICCQQIYCKRMTRSSPNRKTINEWINEWISSGLMRIW